jgi:hypothetical protein
MFMLVVLVETEPLRQAQQDGTAEEPLTSGHPGPAVAVAVVRIFEPQLETLPRV